jgi:hypothetical protein
MRSGAMMIREFSWSWKLNFCKGERELIKDQKYTGGENMSDKAWIYRLKLVCRLQAKVSAKGVYRRGRAVPAVWLKPPRKDSLGSLADEG